MDTQKPWKANKKSLQRPKRQYNKGHKKQDDIQEFDVIEITKRMHQQELQQHEARLSKLQPRKKQKFQKPTVSKEEAARRRSRWLQKKWSSIVAIGLTLTVIGLFAVVRPRNWFSQGTAAAAKWAKRHR